MRVEILSLNNPQTTLINYVINSLKRAFNTEVSLGSSLHLPSYLINTSRSQYRGSEVLTWVSESFSNRGKVIVGIVEGDAYVEGLNFIFGIASSALRTALVFTSRLRWMAGEELFRERVFKEIMHELGHVFGLSHCNNSECVMSFSNSVLDVDRKSWKYCINCFTKLRSFGVEVRDEALL